MSKRGPLSKIEKFYIANNFDSMTVDDMAKDLDRAKSVVKAYSDRCATTKVQEKETVLSSQIFSNKRGSTVMTENGSMISDTLRVASNSKNRTRPESTTRIK